MSGKFPNTIIVPHSWDMTINRTYIIPSYLLNLCQKILSFNPFQRQILDASKVKVLQNRKKNSVGKGKIARYKQFLLFPQCFQKTSTADK